jgi:hypothetical protein
MVISEEIAEVLREKPAAVHFVHNKHIT